MNAYILMVEQCSESRDGSYSPVAATVEGLIVPWRKVLTSACLVDFCVLGTLFTLAVN